MGNQAASGVAVFTSPNVGVPTSDGSRAERLEVWPDPASDRVAIRWNRSDAPGRLEILDVMGRRVRDFTISREGPGSLDWDLRRSDGGRVFAGIHFAIVTASDGTRSTARFVVLP
jgi:hypothetical protein